MDGWTNNLIVMVSLNVTKVLSTQKKWWKKKRNKSYQNFFDAEQNFVSVDCLILLTDFNNDLCKQLKPGLSHLSAVGCLGNHGNQAYCVKAAAPSLCWVVNAVGTEKYES